MRMSNFTINMMANSELIKTVKIIVIVVLHKGS